MLIQTLGRAGAAEHVELVERYLLSADDPMLARAALETLCQDWGLHDRYVAELRAFVAGVDWDDGQARLTAIACAGEYLERRFDRVLLELLLDIFEDPTARDVVRHEAYVALAVAAGREIPGHRERGPSRSSVIAKAKRRLESLS